MNKDTNILIRVSANDKEVIKELAQKAGLSVSAYIMYLINKDRFKDKEENTIVIKEI